MTPEAFLRVLAQEEKNVQERVTDRVVYSLDAEPQEVVAVLETVTLSDTDSAATYALLREMISFAESAYQVKINNPKTADPLTAVLFLLPISAAGLAIVLAAGNMSLASLTPLSIPRNRGIVLVHR